MRILKGKRVVAESAEIAEGFFSKAIGLMFRKSLPKCSALLLVFKKSGKHGIWMPFMRFSIDIVFLNSQKRVVGLHENAKPISLRKTGTWRIFYPDKPASYAIELCAGEIKKKGVRPGDTLKLLHP